jgi:hypothetical protein
LIVSFWDQFLLEVKIVMGLNKGLTRLKITSVLTRVQKAISICTLGSKSQLQGKHAKNCRPTAVRKLAILPAYGRLLRL